MQKSSLSNLIYFSLPTKTGYLCPLSLPFTTFNSNSFRHSNSRKSRFQALTFRQPLAFLGKQYKNFLVVCTPAHSIQQSSSQPLTHQGFVKVEYQTDYHCFLSGKRSAILIKQENEQLRYLRYKGCGNMFSGFVHEVGNGLRGSHFYHTSKREMLMTHQINLALQKRGKIGANKPLGYFEYQSEFVNQMQQGKRVSDDIPNLLKYCCVFETLGQRRLGTHLISSLDIIISQCFQLSFQKLKQLFENKGRYDEGAPSQTPIEWQFTELTESNTFLENMLLKRKQNKQLLNLLNYFNQQIQSNLKQQYHQNQQFIDNIIASFSIIKPYATTLKQKLTKLLSKRNLLQLIMILGSKIGYEVGEVKRIFVEQQINWGFFDDHNIVHCNAHLNNFVILEEKQEYNNCILSPLDFDLSFNKTEYITIDRENPKYGERDDVQFQNLLEGEYKALQLSISGLEVMNFKYGISEEKFESKEKREKYEMLRYLLRDQIMGSFQEGFYLQEKRNWELYEKRKQDVRELIEICLIISMRFQT